MKYLNNKSEIPHRIDTELSKISPFELKDRLIEMASENVKRTAHFMLNAGRGNPNWISTVPREAFFTLGLFAMQECKRTMNYPEGIAGLPQKEGIAARFELFMKENPQLPGIEFLKQTYSYMLLEHAASPNALVHEWTESIIGSQYPLPGRMLKYTEQIVQDYMVQEMCNNCPPEGKFDLFATEGGTAAMCYIFDSLMQNFLLHKGDTVALMTPAFTPYIEIPELARYGFHVINIPADKMSTEGLHLWQYEDKDIDKLKNPEIKALFVINPSNPPSYAMHPDTVKRLIEIVRNDNPDLMIVTDDVYGTFIPNFRSLMAELPQNTLCVYSFSKYFGATGWRLAVVALHENNVYDRLISKLPRKRKGELEKRYESIGGDEENIKFIDRMVADSRQVALNHTAGLSLPQQIQMSFFAAFSLLDKENSYKHKMWEIIAKRLKILWDNTGFTLYEDPLRAGYYSEIDMLVWAKRFYGDSFVDYLKKNVNPLDVVFRLASETSLVLLNGGGFNAPEWSVRVSLANLNEEDYARIGQGIKRILLEYAALWQNSDNS